MSDTPNYRLGTKALHAGHTPDCATNSRAVPIYQTSSYVFNSSEHAAKLFALEEMGNIYTRIMNPTTDVLEKRLAEMDGGGGALAFASGTAAINAAIFNLARCGDNIVSTQYLYGGTYNLFNHTMPRFGIKTKFFDTSNPANVAGAQIVLFECFKSLDGICEAIVKFPGLSHSICESSLTPFTFLVLNHAVGHRSVHPVRRVALMIRRSETSSMTKRSLGIAAVLLGFFAAAASAQRTTGTIRGTVTDTSGAIIAGAQVTATNSATGFSRTTTTNTSGLYVFPDLPVGQYTVSVEFAAFKTAVLAMAKAKVAGNRAEFTAASGARVALTWDGQAKLPAVERDGQPHDWEKHRALWQNGPVTLGWKEGRLVVEAGGRKFIGVMDLAKGTYSFENVPR